MSGDTPQPDEHALDEREARQRIDEIRQRIHARPRSHPDPDPERGAEAAASADPPPSPGRSVLDDPEAMAASMERAAHTDRLEAAIAERDHRIERLEAEVAQLRTALGRVLAVLGEAMREVEEPNSADESDPTG